MTDDDRGRWPRHDPRDPGVLPEDQDRTVYPVPRGRILAEIFRDLTHPRDLVYNR